MNANKWGADYECSPGTPPKLGASCTARRIAWDTHSAAATPKALMSAFFSPHESAITTSPSNVVHTGDTDRATPRLASCASLVAPALLSRAFVATTTKVVFSVKKLPLAPRFISSAELTNSLEPAAR